MSSEEVDDVVDRLMDGKEVNIGSLTMDVVPQDDHYILTVDVEDRPTNDVEYYIDYTFPDEMIFSIRVNGEGKFGKPLLYTRSDELYEHVLRYLEEGKNVFIAPRGDRDEPQEDNFLFFDMKDEQIHVGIHQTVNFEDKDQLRDVVEDLLEEEAGGTPGRDEEIAPEMSLQEMNQKLRELGVSSMSHAHGK